MTTEYVCKYCRVKGSEDYVTSIGPHHDISCPRWSMRSAWIRACEEYDRWRREEDFWWRRKQAGAMARRGY